MGKNPMAGMGSYKPLGEAQDFGLIYRFAGPGLTECDL
jgi:hypothetical protein